MESVEMVQYDYIVWISSFFSFHKLVIHCNGQQRVTVRFEFNNQSEIQFFTFHNSHQKRPEWHTNDGQTQLFIASLNLGVKCICPLSQEFRHSFFMFPWFMLNSGVELKHVLAVTLLLANKPSTWVMWSMLMFYGISNSQNFGICDISTLNHEPKTVGKSFPFSDWLETFVYLFTEWIRSLGMSIVNSVQITSFNSYILNWN